MMVRSRARGLGEWVAAMNFVWAYGIAGEVVVLMLIRHPLFSVGVETVRTDRRWVPYALIVMSIVAWPAVAIWLVRDRWSGRRQGPH
jgi:hypothetical protein